MARYKRGYQAGGGMDAQTAVLRLCAALVDGAECVHCGRPTGFAVELGTMPLGKTICWYQYDPELRTFRRACE